MRLDAYLAAAEQARSRTHAASLIKEGCVQVNGKTVCKPSMDVAETDSVTVIRPEVAYVSRGGLKLHGALETLSMDVTGLECADIGASTGGFTDCLLSRGASHVTAVDTGSGQLAPVLVADPRVTNLENCNARYMTPDTVGGKKDLVVADVSFISQTLLIPAVAVILKSDGRYICLVKPQFECGREALNKNGIVRDKKYHLAALRKVNAALLESGLRPIAVLRSSITGGDGNTEFLILSILSDPSAVPSADIVSDAAMREVVYGKDA
ncbi:MAG: TlyA family RNA methyltransferase [Clostridia bacterium]|nr:TlyA family RNA methyltransferase [Clostridia bacterium]